MGPDDHVAALRRDSAALVECAHRDRSAVVPTCPGWTVGDLVVHTGVVHQRLTKLVRTRSTGPIWPEPGMETDPLRSDLADWFAVIAGDLVSTLEEVGPDVAVWHWFPGGTSRVVIRRAAQETAVHRWDGENALGIARPVEGELAADGVDEVVAAMLPAIVWQYGPPAGVEVGVAGETVHIHCTDGPGEWLLRFALDGLHVSREHARGDLALRGTASDLLLFLWGRSSAEPLEVLGDPALLARWRELAPTI